jgi:hypothetical protein
MNLYIEIQNGAIKNHPAFEDNLIQALGEIPSSWEPFIRVERPVPGMYQVVDPQESIYAKVDGVWTDVWTVRNMTIDEKNAIQQSVRDAFNARDQAENWSAWIFDEDACRMVPPIPRPAQNETKIEQRIRTFWCGADSNWKDTPPLPDDDNQYKFDFFAWQWVEVVS